jgi:class 3 adenylate cyclase
MAGIVGRERYQFDVWGDTVNVASRLCSAASPQTLALTEAEAANITGMAVTPRGAVQLKGKGAVPLVEIAVSPADLAVASAN